MRAASAFVMNLLLSRLRPCSGARFATHPNAARPATARSGFHHDLHVLAERVQEPHQPAAGEIGHTCFEQRRDLRLVDFPYRGARALVQSSTLDNLADLS